MPSPYPAAIKDIPRGSAGAVPVDAMAQAIGVAISDCPVDRNKAVVAERQAWSAVERGSWRALHAALGELKKQGVSRLDSRNEAGETLLMLAAKKGRVAATRALLEWCDPDARDEDGGTALICAVQGARLRCVSLVAVRCDANLRKRHASPSLNGGTALHFSAAGGHGEITRFLSAVCDPKLTTEWGNTALHVACWYGHEHCAEALLAVCDKAEENKGGETALEMAIAGNHTEALARVLRKESDWLFNSKGLNALDLFECLRRHGNPERLGACQMLLEGNAPLALARAAVAKHGAAAFPLLKARLEAADLARLMESKRTLAHPGGNDSSAQKKIGERDVPGTTERKERGKTRL